MVGGTKGFWQLGWDWKGLVLEGGIELLIDCDLALGLLPIQLGKEKSHQRVLLLLD